MAGLPINLNSIFPLSVQLTDEDATKFPQAEIISQAGVTFSSSISLTHTADGLYTNNAITASAAGVYYAKYRIFNEAAFSTTSNGHQTSQDIFAVSAPPASESFIASQFGVVGFVDNTATVLGLVEDTATVLGLVDP
jgi:hypothetical protein